METRKALETDVARMLEIYSHYVLETAISFETATPTLQEFRQRYLDTAKEFPWIVCVVNGKLAGYAYAAPFKTRQAYRWSAESTVYVDQNLRGNGIGRFLYQDLILRLRKMGIVNMIGGISLPNDASISLHEKLGFTQVAHFKNVGFKLGQWWDVGYWQLQLQDPPKKPNEIESQI